MLVVALPEAARNSEGDQSGLLCAELAGTRRTLMSVALSTQHKLGTMAAVAAAAEPAAAFRAVKKAPRNCRASNQSLDVRGLLPAALAAVAWYSTSTCAGGRTRVTVPLKLRL